MKARIKEILIFLLLSIGLGCVEQPKFDPCLGTNVVSADFTVLEQGPGYSSDILLPLNSDSVYFNPVFNLCTIVNGSNVIEDSISDIIGYDGTRIFFKANSPNATSYLWKIGDDARVFTTSGFSLDFEPNSVAGIIKIQLITKGEPRPACKPNDDGIDTVEKFLHFIKLKTNEHHPLEGSYQGYINNNPQDTMTFTIKRAGLIEFDGSIGKKASNDNVKYDIYCEYSINTLAWRLNSDLGKLRIWKRGTINLKSSGFYTDYSYDFGYGHYDKIENKLTYQSQAEIDSVDGQGILRKISFYNYTFTGFKK